MSQTLRIVMLGTGDFALPTFEHLCDQGFKVVALVTQPDRPRGRKQEILPARIKQSAQARGIPVFQPENVNDAASLAVIRGYEPDVLVTAAYGQILSADLLGIPRLGGLNLHGSILPAYRGASPVARAIQHGETETGVTVIQMTPQIDAGGMLAIARLTIDPAETAGELEARLAQLGAPLMARTLEDLAAGKVTPIPQDRGRATRAPKLTKDDGVIHWDRPALEIHNLVRAMQPWPGASTLLVRGSGQSDATRLMIQKTAVASGSGQPGQVLEAAGDRIVVACGEGAVSLLRLQVPGGRPMDAAEFVRGRKIAPGDFLRS